ncbi:ABC transporter ATP-binding protein [Candidatus Gracilibacteria bacterium]|nr:ABC transporter ATP-binding protein [Candidatus Gracilibacteria bacterium]
MKISQRQIRFAVRGAIILAIGSILLGIGIRTLVIVGMEMAPAQGLIAYWLVVLLSTALIWGIGGAFFGAILGMFAALIWREDVSGEQNRGFLVPTVRRT